MKAAIKTRRLLDASGFTDLAEALHVIEYSFDELKEMGEPQDSWVGQYVRGSVDSEQGLTVLVVPEAHTEESEVVDTILHECGHALWELLDEASHAAWNAVANEEDFADNLMHHCTGNRTFMEEPELWHRLVAPDSSTVAEAVADQVLESSGSALAGVVRAYARLTASGLPLGGGNCGQAALAVLHHVLPAEAQLGMITNAESEEELQEGEPDVYHVYLVVDGQRVDETGLIDADYLLDLALDQYGNEFPQEFLFDVSESSKATRIIATQTAWSLPWERFAQALGPSGG